MVTVRTRKLGTCRLGKPHWNAGRRQTSVGKERWFLEGQSSPRSNAFRFEPRTPERWHWWGQVFPRPLERSRVSSWVSCICLSFWQLQSQPHWPRWWHSVGGRHCPKCRPLLRPMWRCNPSSTAAASNHRAACHHHEPACVVPSCWGHPRESSSARWHHWYSCGAVFCWWSLASSIYSVLS